jgi:hypothetical protein
LRRGQHGSRWQARLEQQRAIEVAEAFLSRSPALCAVGNEDEGTDMATLNMKHGEIQVSAERVGRMADRMYRLGGEGRSKNYAEKARKRLEAGTPNKNDVAIVIAAGG